MTSRRWSIRQAIVLVAIVALGSPVLHAAAPCEDLKDPCAARACRIDADLAKARAKGNASDVARLERARGEMSHCSADGLEQKRKMALDQAQRKVDQRAAELKKAEATGNAAAIKKAQGKLDSAQKTLADLQKAPL